MQADVGLLAHLVGVWQLWVHCPSCSSPVFSICFSKSWASCVCGSAGHQLILQVTCVTERKQDKCKLQFLPEGPSSSLWVPVCPFLPYFTSIFPSQLLAWGTSGPTLDAETTTLCRLLNHIRNCVMPNSPPNVFTWYHSSWLCLSDQTPVDKVRGAGTQR